MNTRKPRRHRRPAPMAEVVSVQEEFPLDDLRHVQLATWRADHSFFRHALADESYSRTLFCGRGLLFLARPALHRPAWRVYLAWWFTPAGGGAQFTLLPHAAGHTDAATARQTAETLAAQMHTGPPQQALGLFAARQHKPAP
ncbi:hypothetical protein ACPCTO_37660 [Streptomyces olivoreticuli]